MSSKGILVVVLLLLCLSVALIVAIYRLSQKIKRDKERAQLKKETEAKLQRELEDIEEDIYY